MEPTTAHQREAVTRAMRLLSSTGAPRMTVTALSRHLGYSPWHFCRLFRRISGRTMTTYRERVRLARALRRLREAPDTDLTYLALELGYCSHSHFTSTFRRTLGYTPSSFAAARRRRRRYAISA